MVINVYRLFLHAMVILALYLMYSNLGHISTKFILAVLLFVYYLFIICTNYIPMINLDRFNFKVIKYYYFSFDLVNCKSF
jgi:hypothetical protein